MMESQSLESEVLRRFFSNIHETIVQPRDVAFLLYQEGVVSEQVVDEVVVTGKPCSEKNAAVMRAVEAAVKADPKKVWILIGVLEKFAEPAPVASRMREELSSRGIEGKEFTFTDSCKVQFAFFSSSTAETLPYCSSICSPRSQ